jgi:hypothetical protein
MCKASQYESNKRLVVKGPILTLHENIASTQITLSHPQEKHSKLVISSKSVHIYSLTTGLIAIIANNHQGLSHNLRF